MRRFAKQLEAAAWSKKGRDWAVGRPQGTAGGTGLRWAPYFWRATLTDLLVRASPFTKPGSRLWQTKCEGNDDAGTKKTGQGKAAPVKTSGKDAPGPVSEFPQIAQ